MSLMGWQSRYIEAIARLTGEENVEVIPPGILLEDFSNHDELSFLKRERLCFAGITANAGGAGVSSGVVLRAPANNAVLVITGAFVQKATAGFASAQVIDTGFGNLVASFAFFRDNRWGPYATARPTTKPFTHTTVGGLPAGNVVRRVQLAAGIFTDLKLPTLILADPNNAGGIQFGVFNETLNEAMDVMIDFYEREARPEELILS